ILVSRYKDGCTIGSFLVSIHLQRTIVMRFDFSKVEVKADINYIERSFLSIFIDSINVFKAHYEEYFSDFSYDPVAGASTILSKVLSKLRRITCLLYI
ncbi:MAG: hypothetical protein ACMUJM_24740, partial [bacterium]